MAIRTVRPRARQPGWLCPSIHRIPLRGLRLQLRWSSGQPARLQWTHRTGGRGGCLPAPTLASSRRHRTAAAEPLRRQGHALLPCAGVLAAGKWLRARPGRSCRLLAPALPRQSRRSRRHLSRQRSCTRRAGYSPGFGTTSLPSPRTTGLPDTRPARCRRM